MNLGTSEILIIAVIVIALFGASWVPKMARNLGKTKVELDKAKAEFEKTKNEFADQTGLKEAGEALNKANKTLKQPAKEILKTNLTSDSSLTSDAAKTAKKAAGEIIPKD